MISPSAILTSPASPTLDEARDALIELFVLATSHENFIASNGRCMEKAERCFATAMKHTLELSFPAVV